MLCGAHVYVTLALSLVHMWLRCGDTHKHLASRWFVTGLLQSDAQVTSWPLVRI